MRKDVYLEVQRQMNNGLKINCAELARRMDCDPRTVKRYITNMPIRKKGKRKTLIDDFKSTIIDKVDNYGATAMSIYDFIRDKGYDGSYPTVRRFVRNHKNKQYKKATVRFETTPGLQAQVDWKEEFKITNRSGEVFTINIFLYILGYSRFKYIELTLDRKQDTLLKCMTNAFKYCDGIAKEILFDNMATIVDRANSKFNDTKINKVIHQFSNDMHFIVRTCRPYRPQTKGKVEVVARLMDRLKVYNNEFDTIEELTDIVKELNIKLNNEVSQATGDKPIHRLLSEKEYLLPLPSTDIIDSYTFVPIERKVTKESMITYNGKKYSVPTAYIGETVQITPYAGTIKIYYKSTFITSHNISNKLFNYNKEHYKDILQSDAFSNKSEEFIEERAQEYLSNLDNLLEG